MIFITGISGGLGKQLAHLFFDSGQTVIGTYLNNPPDFGNKSINTFKLDVSDHIEVQKLVGSLDLTDDNIIVINNAAISYNASAHKTNYSEWSKVIDINLKGCFAVISCFLPVLREKKFGRIINISSVLAEKSFFGVSAYSSSKAGLKGLAKSIALENAKYNITVNNIILGYMDTGLIEQVPTEYKKQLLNEIPVGRLGNVVDLFKAIKFLIDSDYVTGAEININGGLY